MRCDSSPVPLPSLSLLARWTGAFSSQRRMICALDGGVTYSTSLFMQGNYLRCVGVKKGDAVAIYMPLVCELPIAMLACARIGAVHSVVFGGFSAESLAQRIQDCKARVVLTASGTKRGASC